MEESETTPPQEASRPGTTVNETSIAGEERTAQGKKWRRRSSLLCNHCDKWVSNSTFYRHREVYYDSVAKVWTKSTAVTTCGTQQGRSTETPEDTDSDVPGGVSDDDYSYMHERALDSSVQQSEGIYYYYTLYIATLISGPTCT